MSMREIIDIVEMQDLRAFYNTAKVVQNIPSTPPQAGGNASHYFAEIQAFVKKLQSVVGLYDRMIRNDGAPGVPGVSELIQLLKEFQAQIQVLTHLSGSSINEAANPNEYKKVYDVVIKKMIEFHTGFTQVYQGLEQLVDSNKFGQMTPEVKKLAEIVGRLPDAIVNIENRASQIAKMTDYTKVNGNR